MAPEFMFRGLPPDPLPLNPNLSDTSAAGVVMPPVPLPRFTSSARSGEFLTPPVALSLGLSLPVPRYHVFNTWDQRLPVPGSTRSGILPCLTHCGAVSLRES